MKIAITTLYTPEIADFSKEAVKNFRMYCDLHGYDLFVYEKTLLDGLRGNWCKPKVLLNHIKDYDYVVWLDSDIAILDFNKKLEDIIKPYADKLMITTDDMGGWKINNGFMIFKNTDYINDVLQVLWRQQSKFTNKQRGDQKFFIEFLQQIKFPENKCHTYPQSEICAPLTLKNDKSFSVHVMGIHINDVRRKYIKHINNNQKTNQEKIPLNKLNEFLKLKDEWHKLKDYDFIKYLSSQISCLKVPNKKYNCYNPGKKIAIVSLYTPEIADFAACSEKSIREYCEKQGYTFYIYRESIDAGASPNWSKARAILNHIDNHESIVWMDSDTIVYNPNKKFEDILDQCVPMKKIIACEDIGASNKKLKKGSMLNSGVVIFRNHQYTKNIIAKWMNFDGDKSFLYASGGDQEILCNILKKSDGFGFNRKIFPMNKFNTDPRMINRDTFIVHFMAYPHELKKIFMNYWMQ